MEGRGVDLLIQDLKERNLGVKLICHDDDSGTSKQFNQSFGPGQQDPPMENQQGLLFPIEKALIGNS